MPESTTQPSSRTQNKISILLPKNDTSTKTEIRVRAAKLDYSVSKYVGRLMEEVLNGNISLPEEKS